ncbi:MAG: cupin domain-containing protein [Janthinobacterium lividum]
MVQHLVAWNEVEAMPAPGGVTKRRIDLPGMSLVTVTVPAGTEASRHRHDHDQFVQVISGSGTLTTEQGARPFAANSVFVFPAGVWHSARFDSDTVLVETNHQEVGG